MIPLRDLPIEMDSSRTDLRELANRTFEAYKQTIPDDTKHLLDRYRFVDVALKVVGVGSVGNLCLILLLEGRDSTDPLFLQMKQAKYHRFSRNTSTPASTRTRGSAR